MIDDQADIIGFLEGKGPGDHQKPDKIVHTHGAIITLYKTEALKIKRAVKYDYLDFSTLDLRHRMLLRELELNRLAAPDLYRDVVPITEDPQGQLHIGGAGEVVEWVLRMKRFSPESELSVMADKGRIDPNLADALGRSVANYHRQAPVLAEDGALLIQEIIEELDGVLPGMTDALGRTRIETVMTSLRQAFHDTTRLMRQRGQDGWIRRCHGDLHLRNIILWEGAPTLIDALEFDERLGTCDVLYDLAFLLMDLSHRQLEHEANTAMNAYLFHAGSDDHLDGLALLPLYLSIRATIRAMVDVQTAALQGNSPALIADAAAYMDQAQGFMQASPPILVAVGGLSGSGKTSVARRIASKIGRRPGAIHIRSDLERKAYFNVDPLEHLPSAAYTKEVSQKIYDRMREKAERALLAGQSVILDSVHGSLAERAAARKMSTDLGCKFLGVWLDLDTQTRVARVERRKGDASDADADVATRQAAMHLGEIDWIMLDAGSDIADLTRKILSLISSE